MILDAKLMFSKEQEVTESVDSSVIDLDQPGDAVGQELTIRTVVSTTFAGLTSLSITLKTSADNVEWKDVIMVPAVSAADLTKGAEVFSIRVPKGLRRFVKLAYTVTGAGTAGKLTAFMSKEI
jgi:hypothetical protein